MAARPKSAPSHTVHSNTITATINTASPCHTLGATSERSTNSHNTNSTDKPAAVSTAAKCKINVEFTTLVEENALITGAEKNGTAPRKPAVNHKPSRAAAGLTSAHSHTIVSSANCSGANQNIAAAFCNGKAATIAPAASSPHTNATNIRCGRGGCAADNAVAQKSGSQKQRTNNEKNRLMVNP